LGVCGIETKAPLVDKELRARAAAFLVLIFVGGGIGGTLLDQIHVRSQVLHYAHPNVAGEALWVVPEFGVAATVALLSAIWMTKRLWQASRDAVPVIADASMFVVAYTVTGVFHRHSWVVLIMLICLWAGMISLHRDRRAFVLMSVALAIAGPIYEGAFSSTGAFRYDVTPLVGRVPIWLPALYLNAGVLAASVARALTRRPRTERPDVAEMP
jgi:hypothetical protein